MNIPQTKTHLLDEFKGGEIMFRNAKVGDKVWDNWEHRECIIEKICFDFCFPIRLNNGKAMNFKGNHFNEYDDHRYSWIAYNFPIQKRPKRLVKKTFYFARLAASTYLVDKVCVKPTGFIIIGRFLFDNKDNMLRYLDFSSEEMLLKEGGKIESIEIEVEE